MKLLLFDAPDVWTDLLPLTFTRPVAGLRVGILTIAEKWEHECQNIGREIGGYLTAHYLEKLFSCEVNIGDDVLAVAGHILPDQQLIDTLLSLDTNQNLTADGRLVASRLHWTGADSLVAFLHQVSGFQTKDIQVSAALYNPTDIFALNSQEIKADFKRITSGRSSELLTDPHTVVYGKENLFIEPGASIRAAVINAEEGPVYIGKNAQVQEGVLIKGPLALCEGAVLNMGAKMRGDNTVGPYSKVGGEVSNSVFQAYSNKGHDGFIGNSVIGAWCNLGADTNNSNLKNNYQNVSIHNYGKNGPKDTGKLFCGLIMGDHSKAGINTMFNTGTVVGVGCNVYGGGFPAKHIRSFTWGGAQEGYSTYKLNKLLETERIVMSRRKLDLTSAYEEMLQHLYQTMILESTEAPKLIQL